MKAVLIEEEHDEEDFSNWSDSQVVRRVGELDSDPSSTSEGGSNCVFAEPDIPDA
jgi:hypothetical protein